MHEWINKILTVPGDFWDVIKDSSANPKALITDLSVREACMNTSVHGIVMNADTEGQIDILSNKFDSYYILMPHDHILQSVVVT